jgi:hypothetical protein
MNYTQENFLQYLFNNIPEYKQYWVNASKGWEDSLDYSHLEYLFYDKPEDKQCLLDILKKREDKPYFRTFGMEAQTLLWFTVSEIEKGNSRYLKLIFDLIEDMLNSDNEDAQYAAYMMFLESLYFRSDELPSNLYSKYLGSKSKEAIDEIARS